MHEANRKVNNEGDRDRSQLSGPRSGRTVEITYSKKGVSSGRDVGTDITHRAETPHSYGRQRVESTGRLVTAASTPTSNSAANPWPATSVECIVATSLNGTLASVEALNSFLSCRKAHSKVGQSQDRGRFAPVSFEGDFG